MKKKGSWFVDNLGQMVLMAIGLGVGIYLIWAYVLHGGGDSINAAQQCGTLTTNNGECKESCDPILELEFPDLGCKGLTNKCCVVKDPDSGDVILPSGYGGDSTYDFEVVSIAFGTTPGCTRDPRNQKVAICPPNRQYSIPVTIIVRNTKTNIVPMVYADPAVVINGNGDNIRKPGTYTGKVGAQIPVNGQATVTTNIVVSVSDAKVNNYWDVYPYAICTDKLCKATDSQSRGIMSMNGNDFVTIKFID